MRYSYDFLKLEWENLFVKSIVRRWFPVIRCWYQFIEREGAEEFAEQIIGEKRLA